MRPHHKLEAWSKAVDLVTDVYKKTDTFPKEERYGLTSQIRRAAVSIPANIAEGAGRHSRKEFAHFLSNSQGSASELETELIIAHRLGYLDEASFSGLVSEVDRIGRLITGLSRHLTNWRPLKVNYGTSTTKKNARVDCLHRQRQRATNNAFGRGFYSRRSTCGNARHLFQSANEGLAKSRSCYPLRAQPPTRMRSAVRST